MSNTEALITRLRNTPNWLREAFGDWKTATSVYDRAPFEAADALTAQAAELEAMRERLDFHVAFTREAQDLGMAAQRQVAEQAAQIEALKRWKSTHAPRIDALEGLLHAAQINAHAGREAIARLASEREANALLTSEVEALRADAERWRYAIAPGVDQSMRWLDVYEYWSGEDDFTAAIDAAMKAGKAVENT